MNEDLTSLIEQHQKDIWEWKQKESQWIRDKNQLEGHNRIVEELSTEIVNLRKANLPLKKRAQEAEGENTIIKGIGNNSPEMKELQGRLSSAQDINDKYQRENKEKEDLVQELRMRIRDMLLISEQHRSILGAEITDRKRLEQEVKDLKVQMSEYMSVRVDSARKSGA